MRNINSKRIGDLRSLGKKSRQKGWAMVELALALMLATMVTLYNMPTSVKEAQDASIDVAGFYAVTLKGALDNYLIANRDALANSQPATGFADPMAPTIQELIAAKLLSTNFPTTITRQNIPVQVKITTSNCPGNACDVEALAYGTRPLTALGSPEVRYDLVARFLEATKGFGASSKFGDGATIKSSVFNTPNPMGNVPGIIAIGTNLDQGMYNQFVKIKDTRDPSLQGDLTVKGGITAQSSLAVATTSTFGGNLTGMSNVGTSDGSSPCLRASLQPDGSVLSRDINCVTRAQLASNGSVSSMDGSGNVKAGFNYNSSGQSQAFADNLMNTVNNAGITKAGNVYGASSTFGALTLNDTQIVGSACATANSAAWGMVGAVPVFLKCQAGSWQSVGTVVGSQGSACTTQGVTGMDNNGVALYCQNSVWVTYSDRFGKLTVMARFYAPTGAIVPKPTCPASGTPLIYNIPQSAATSRGFVNFRFVDNGPSWTLLIENAGGQDSTGLSLVETICSFS